MLTLRITRAAVALLLVVGGAACSSPDANSESDSAGASDGSSASEPAVDDPKKTEGDRRNREPGRAHGDPKGATEGGVAANDGEGGKGGKGETGAGDSDDSPPVAAWPAAGSYSYDQAGYEEFCSGTCDRERLPPHQKVTNEIESQTVDATVVISEAKTSDTRVARTTFRYTDDTAYITEVYARLSFGTFEYSESYRPEPPVESLRFPLEVGDEWSGSWKADVSGDYSVSVLGKERVEVGSTTHESFVIDTSATFRGEFQGSTEMRVWIDPRSKAILRTDGHLRVESQFGTYETEFVTRLRSGPGYR